MKTIISSHQPAYNPWLGYIHKILLSDIFVIMDDVQFEKNSFINRNKILQNSKEIWLTIPVKTKGYKDKTIKDMEILDNKWKIKHLKSIEQAYKRSDLFNIVFKEFEQIYSIKSNFLIDYTNAYLEFIIKYLEIDTKILFASNLNIKEKKLNYVIELTHKLNGNIFVFGSQGKDYADTEYLKANGIFPYFQNYKHPEYKQLSSNFHSYIGVVDLFFNETRESIKDIILNNNIKKEELRILGE